MTVDPSKATETDASPSTPAPVSPSDEGSTGGTQASGGVQPHHVALGVFIALLAVAVVLIALFFAALRHWLALHTGILNGGPDRYYNFWSGFGSDLGEATLISAVGVGLYTGLRKVNCHTKGCWRIGHHPLDGTPYILCRHHHPSVPTGGASHQHILEEHRRYKEAVRARESTGL